MSTTVLLLFARTDGCVLAAISMLAYVNMCTCSIPSLWCDSEACVVWQIVRVSNNNVGFKFEWLRICMGSYSHRSSHITLFLIKTVFFCSYDPSSLDVMPTSNILYTFDIRIVQGRVYVCECNSSIVWRMVSIMNSW